MKKQKTSLFLAKIAALLELSIAAVIVVIIIAAGIMLVVDTFSLLQAAPRSLDIGQFLSDALGLIVGIEFVKMLLKHTPGTVVEVLLFAIAREMVVTHTNSLETLFGVIAVAVIFFIRRFLYRDDPTHEDTLDH